MDLKEKIKNIAIDENASEKEFSENFSKYKDLWKASTVIALKIKRYIRLNNANSTDLAIKI